jgi:hypothetical protein
MFSNFRRIFGTLAKELLVKGDTVKAIEVVHRGLEIVPADKLPYDFFTIGLAEILLRAGRQPEGEKLINDIIVYSKSYLDYIINIKPGERYGLEYPTGINMQALIDIYNMVTRLKLDNLVKLVEPEVDKYYGRLYSAK